MEVKEHRTKDYEGFNQEIKEEFLKIHGNK